jgi:hypothetical protein
MRVSYSALKNETHPIGPGGYQEPVSHYPHTGARIQQQQAGMGQVRIHTQGYAAMSGQSNHRASFFAVENGRCGTYDSRMPQRKIRIKIEHRIEYPDPIRVAAGEQVNVGREDAEFPGWRWCKALDGREGWVPAELLSNEGAEATVLQDYSARELTVETGEEVVVEESRHDWLLVRNGRGERGWIPAANTEPL